MKKRVLILMSDTGGGHRAAAEAIRDALYLEQGKDAVAVELVDVFRDYSPVPLKYVPEIYPRWVNHSKTSWGVSYNLSNTRGRARIVSTTLYHAIENGLKRMFREHPADVIVCVHSLVARPAMKALMLRATRAPFVVVVTDLVSTHHLWYEKRAERCLVPTRAAYDTGLETGLQPAQMRVTGLPVHPHFVRSLTSKSEARQALGWDPTLPAILLVGGGDGMGPVYRTARAINERRLNCQLIVIAGRNDALHQQLETSNWNQPTQIYGFRKDMPVILAATDILVTKAGPATITEACIAGVPMILYDAIPGQETGNVDYVVSNKVGVFAPTPQEIGDVVTGWLAEGPESLRQRSERTRALGHPNAVFDIAEEVWHYAHMDAIPTDRLTLWKGMTKATRAFTKELDL
ncbi:MAG: glycosyltransferase [Anaerolineae bacterium]|nr:glycosyltransferase [Anaerolineae bacterium]